MNILLFDFDGVIADSFDIIYKIVKESLQEFNIAIKNKNDFLKLYKNNWYESVINKGFPKNTIPQLIKSMQKKLLLSFHKAKIFPGMKNTLQKLQKHKIIIITSCPAKIVKNFMKKNNIPALQVMGPEKETSKTKKIESVKRKYPESEIYYIGDTAGDIKEGLRASVKTVAVTWGYHKRKILASENPNFIVSKPKELLRIFNQ